MASSTFAWVQNQSQFQWESELAMADELRLQAPQSDRWVESWQLVFSPRLECGAPFWARPHL